MPIKTTQEKFIHELGDILDAENRFLKGQQEMLEQATDETLKSGLQTHIGETEQQIKNLEQVFSAIGEEPKTEKCDAAQGLVSEAKKSVSEAGTPELRDCLIGSSVTKNEHYEIASYRGLIEGARLMGQDQVVTLLQQNLQQEEKTAQLLESNAPKLLQKAMQSEQ